MLPISLNEFILPAKFPNLHFTHDSRVGPKDLHGWF